jgi:cellulose synthase/poly-beta-1,6-N-acetylglucosamine synthase-like glycosyltransferase
MDLFREYRRRYPVREALIDRAPPSLLFNVVVIPCYDEEVQEVAATLDALAACTPPHRPVEVIVVINAPAGAGETARRKNRDLYDFLRSSPERWEHEMLSLIPLLTDDLPPREAGVGLARKIGMDEALYRFAAAGSAGEGILTSLDADTRVEKNYLTALENHFLQYPRRQGVSVCFEHPLQGPYPASVYNGIIQYELHLRYFVEALRHTGHPYAFHTIGSAFAVRAATYMRLGGMNKRQGGEDFYFLQKVIMTGDYATLTSTRVMPSPRPSGRVPFGTGPETDRFMKGEKETFLTYSLAAFTALKHFFDLLPRLYEKGTTPDTLYASLPLPLKHFLSAAEFVSRIEEIRGNVATQQSFMKRFFRWFNTFKVIKYLNMIHQDLYERQPVVQEAEELLRQTGEKTIPVTPEVLLMYYRQREQQQGTA